MLPLKPRSYIRLKMTILSVVMTCASCGWIESKKSHNDDSNHTRPVDETANHSDGKSTTASTSTDQQANPSPTNTPEPTPVAPSGSLETKIEIISPEKPPVEPVPGPKPKVLFFSGNHVFSGNQAMYKRYRPNAWESSIEYVNNNVIEVQIEDTGEIKLNFKWRPDNSSTYTTLPDEWDFPAVAKVDDQNQIAYAAEAVQTYRSSQSCDTPTKVTVYPEQNNGSVFIRIKLDVSESVGTNCRYQNRMTGASFDVASFPGFGVGKWQNAEGETFNIKDDGSLVLPKQNAIYLHGISTRYSGQGYESNPMVHVEGRKWKLVYHWLEYQSDGVHIKCEKDFISTFEFLDEGHAVIKTRYNFCVINPQTGYEYEEIIDTLNLTKTP